MGFTIEVCRKKQQQKMVCVEANAWFDFNKRSLLSGKAIGTEVAF